MADKNFRVKNGLETPLIAGSDGTTSISLIGAGDVNITGDLTVTGNDIKYSSGTTQITLASGGVVLAGDLQVNGNDIKSSSGQTSISLSNDDVTVSDRLFVVGNVIGSNGGFTALTFNQNDVEVRGDLTVTGGNILGPGSGSDLVIENASTIQIKNDFTLFATDAGVTEAYFNLTGGKFTFNGTDTDNTNNYNLYSHGTLGSLTDTTVGGTLYLKGSTSGSVGLKGAAAAGSTTYTLPSSDGSSGQVLSTNGTGTLSWATAGGGGGGGTSLPAIKSENLAAQPWSTLPGCVILGSIGNSLTMAAQTVRYQPFYVSAPITLTEVALQVSTATSLASCNAMIYIVDVTPSTTGWQPSANRSGGYCGEITSIATTGIKSITGLSISLPAGAYLMAVQYSNYTGTLQCRSIPNQVITGNGYAFSTADGTTYAMNRTGVTYTSGTPASAANWTNGGYGNAGHPGVVWAKWTVN